MTPAIIVFLKDIGKTPEIKFSLAGLLPALSGFTGIKHDSRYRIVTGE